MTLIGVGKPVPSQLFLMQLAGLVIEGRARVENPTEEQVARSQREGYQSLKELTGEDFGCDIGLWFEFLVINSEQYGITHPYGYGSMRRLMEELGQTLPWKKDIQRNR